MGNFVNTNETVERSGVYRCETCGNTELHFTAGEKAPSCKNCNFDAVTWEFRRPLGQRPIGFVIP
jgi:rubrerythrin